jgi:TRAP-type mannitol/chloroaromatic compound transport system permease small subunit
MDDHRSRIWLKIILYCVFIVAGVILVIYASFSLIVFDGSGSHRVFVNEFGVPGILAIVVGLVGLFWLSITKWSR